MKSLSEGIDATRQTIDRLTAGMGDKGMSDPRGGKTLGEAAMNPDGTFNGARALSWLSEALNPGKGASELCGKLGDDGLKRAAYRGW
ncbi:hypothetical protein CRT60_08715 [Azospirillum palustre]|uniref:Uncharacterized protein n=1 Tax=Azospirillum palustre TaxID=2044885 RepID=A0A2B8BJV6_9PROT|nr:hypothetical protein [Azospirillum palustre]PGH58030.1 hypothetical protein CRT60_08715 [Azospirillum palustre]